MIASDSFKACDNLNTTSYLTQKKGEQKKVFISDKKITQKKKNKTEKNKWTKIM